MDAPNKTEKTKLFKKKVAKTRSLYDLFQDLQSSDGTVDIADLEKDVANEYDVSTTYTILRIQMIFCGFFFHLQKSWKFRLKLLLSTKVGAQLGCLRKIYRSTN